MDRIEFLYQRNKDLPKINPNGKAIRGVKPKEYKSHFRYDFNDPLAFLDAFDINKSELYNDGDSLIHCNFLFRGHYDSEWKLQPSLYRQDKDETDVDYKKRVHSYKQIDEFFHEEMDLFSRYIKGLNSLDYYISEGSFKIMNAANKIDFLNGTNNKLFEFYPSFPNDDQLTELALAQHHGIKTRLLDFTESPYNAIFFASECAFPYEEINEEVGKKIGVWIIPKLLIEAVQQSRYMKLIETKKFQNKNLSAQNGVFINYYPPLDFFIGDTELRRRNYFLDIQHTLDDLLTAEFKNSTLNKIINKIIGKPMLFTLPHKELLSVSRKLEQLGINWSSLMPSLHGLKIEIDRQMNRIG